MKQRLLRVVLVGLVMMAGATPTIDAATAEVRALEDQALTIYRAIARAASAHNPPRLAFQSEDEYARKSSGAQRRERVAYFQTTGAGTLGHYSQRTIVIDHKALKICAEMQSQSDPCIAFLLGHELAHAINNHDEDVHFATEHNREQRRASPGLDEMSRKERHADELGGLYASLAGYQALEAAPAVLTRIYSSYGLQRELEGYPSLHQRQQAVTQAAEVLESLRAFFDAGLLLFSLEEYEAAAECFAKIRERFPSREVLNNLGVAKALAGIRSFSQDRNERHFPFLLDGESRLPRLDGARSAADRERREFLLAAAQADLEAAAALDGDYPIARLNTALVIALRKRSQHLALGHLEEAEQSKAGVLPQPSLVLARAVVFNHYGNTEEAGQALQALAPDTLASLPDWWRQTLRGEKPSSPAPIPFADARRAGYFDGKRPSALAPTVLSTAEKLGGAGDLQFGRTDRYRFIRVQFPSTRDGRNRVISIVSPHDGVPTPGNAEGSVAMGFGGGTFRLYLRERQASFAAGQGDPQGFIWEIN